MEWWSLLYFAVSYSRFACWHIGLFTGPHRCFNKGETICSLIALLYARLHSETQCRVCWRNFGFRATPPSRFFVASLGILGLWKWLLCRRIRSWREWHTRWRGRLTSWSERPLQIQALWLWMVFLSILMSPSESGKPNHFLLLISSDLKNFSRLWIGDFK
jgi:hypothetical protein